MIQAADLLKLLAPGVWRLLRLCGAATKAGVDCGVRERLKSREQARKNVEYRGTDWRVGGPYTDPHCAEGGIERPQLPDVVF